MNEFKSFNGIFKGIIIFNIIMGIITLGVIVGVIVIVCHFLAKVW